VQRKQPVSLSIVLYVCFMYEFDIVAISVVFISYKNVSVKKLHVYLSFCTLCLKMCLGISYRPVNHAEWTRGNCCAHETAVTETARSEAKQRHWTLTWPLQQSAQCVFLWYGSRRRVVGANTLQHRVLSGSSHVTPPPPCLT
jgi:hypothetical protein